MAENINISFAPNKNADEAQRIADIENYLQTLTERTKFAFSTIIEDYNNSAKADTNTHATSGLTKFSNAINYNDPVIISKNTADYLKYEYSAVGYNASEDLITYAQDGKSSIIVQGYSACPYYIHELGTEHGKLYFTNGIYRYRQNGAIKFDTLSFYIYVSEFDGYYKLYMVSEYTKDGTITKKYENTTAYTAVDGDFSVAIQWVTIYSPTNDYPNGSAELYLGMNYNRSVNGIIKREFPVGVKIRTDFSSIEEYNAAVQLTKSSAKKYKVSQTAIKSEHYDSSASLPETGEAETIYTTAEPAAAWRFDSVNGEYLCVGRDYNEIKEVKSDIYGTDEVNVMKLPVRQLTKSSEEWEADSTIYPRGMMLIAQDLETEFGRRNSAIRIANGIDNWSGLSDTNYLPISTSDTLGGVKIGGNIAVADDGTISVDLSAYLQSSDIADWAKQPNKPVYTASEVGAAAEQHKHSTADITDFPAIPTKVSELQNDSGYLSTETDPTVPAWAKADTKPTYTATEVGAAAESHNHTVAEITDMPDWAKQPVKPTYTASEVGAATVADIKAAVDGIEIGGRNYLLNTKTFSAASSTALSGALLSGAASLSEEIYNGLSVRGGAIADSQSIICRYGFKYFGLGDTFTFSFFAKGNVPELRVFFYGETGYVQVAECINSQGETNTNSDGRCSFTVTDDWKRYWVKWTLKTTGDTSVAKWILMRTYNSVVGQEIYVCGCKLEKGNINTDWSPDPEDFYSLAERVSALEAAALSGGE